MDIPLTVLLVVAAILLTVFAVETWEVLRDETHHPR